MQDGAIICSPTLFETMARIKHTPVKLVGAHPIKMEGTEEAVAVKKPRRYRPGTVAIREIRHHQKSGNLLIPKRCFMRLVREIAQEYSSDIRFAKNTFIALQEATEDALVDVMKRAQLNAIHCNRTTIMKQDMKLISHQ
jgi:histone H3/H4